MSFWLICAEQWRSSHLALWGPTFLWLNDELALSAESSIASENMPKSLTHVPEK